MKHDARRFDDGLPVMIWRARPDMGCEHVNRAWLDFTGYDAVQALGDGWSRALHPEDLARWLDTCVRAFDERTPFEIEYRLRRRDGEYRWVLDRAAPRLADGLFLGYGGACIDIDARRRQQDALARSLERERRLRVAVEEASRLRQGLVLSVLHELQPPAHAIATWAAHLRGQTAPGSDAAFALDEIERDARSQSRVIGNLLELSGEASEWGRRAAREEPLLAGVRVLVVEAEGAARDSLLEVLRIAGADTHAAASTPEALQAVGAWQPDVLLSDLGRRGEDGFALIKALRALPAESGGCLRAAALAPPSAPPDRRAMAAGYDALLAQPVEPVALLATVARLAQPAGP